MELMKTQLSQIVKNKKKTKDELSYLKNRYIAIIYGGLARHDNLATIRKKLYNETINQKKKGYEINTQMLNYAFKVTETMHKKTVNVLDGMIGSFVFDLLKNKQIEKKMYSIIVKYADKQEGNEKAKVLKNVLQANIESSDENNIKIFYLASWHKDSASDHKNYQGKVYVDANWKNIPLPYETKEKISSYIKIHDIKTLQWVTGEPVWFITRPNCRHYFRELTFEEVFGKSNRKLLNKYDMKTAIGDREYLQTIRHATDKKWYDDVRNAQLLLKSYESRLEMHNMMYTEKPLEIIKSAITKDRFLINKWKDYIKKAL